MSRIARLAWSLWIGAVACVALVVAPTTFGRLDDARLAGEVMAPIFKTVDIFGILAAGLFVLAALKSRWRAVLAGLAGLAAAVNAFYIAPKIASRADGWETWHRVSTGLWTAILVIGILLALVGPGHGKRD